MLKKMALVVATVALIPTSSLFAKDTGPGCGLGTMVLGETKTTVMQLVATSLNGLSGNQTFGITSGTLGCQADSFAVNQKVDSYFIANFENLKEEMAQGEGEYLSSLAVLLEIPAAQQASFYEMTQENYSQLIKTENTTAQEALLAMSQQLKNKAYL
ncbi:DUF3015 family protein [Deltaproteobacteria bacterium TL4]